MRFGQWTDLLLALVSLITLSGRPVDRGIASLYRPWDRSDPTVPYGRYPGNWKLRPTRSDLVCAHRTIPFGTILRLESRGRASGICVVLDRGPYGFCQRAEGKRDRRCPSDHRYMVTVNGKRLRGHYRGVIDATPAVHRMMGSNGWIRVTVVALDGVRLRRALKLKDFVDVSSLFSVFDQRPASLTAR